ncbi:MAG: hypothetical protein R3290_13815, partial [Acidimicrobiia bacterium]|nr:hypothetical protein [Acidimicrobiia bacterium]
RKTMAIRSLEGFDVLVTDDPGDAGSFARIAAEEGIACVLAAEPHLDDDVAAAFEDRPLVMGADLPAIAECLAAHEIARGGADLQLMVAWTAEGSPVRSGEAIPFPDPVGARWGRVTDEGPTGRIPITRVVCPVDDEWAGAMARVTSADREGVQTRVVGVADLGVHLRAIALAAAAIGVAGDRVFEPGVVRPVDAAEDYLRIALAIGMDVASFTED